MLMDPDVRIIIDRALLFKLPKKVGKELHAYHSRHDVRPRNGGAEHFDGRGNVARNTPDQARREGRGRLRLQREYAGENGPRSEMKKAVRGRRMISVSGVRVAGAENDDRRHPHLSVQLPDIAC